MEKRIASASDRTGSSDFNTAESNGSRGGSDDALLANFSVCGSPTCATYPWKYNATTLWLLSGAEEDPVAVPFKQLDNNAVSSCDDMFLPDGRFVTTGVTGVIRHLF